jgi:predicted AAA+ superfamily ATPase
MIPRQAQAAVIAGLARQAAVVLLGPRQVGKTTLAHAIGDAMGALHLDLEDSEDRARLALPGPFLDAMADRLVVLDEIHRMPELFDTLRGVIDRGRRSGRGKGRFLILGSASIDLMRQAESLAGRTAFVELPGLIASEVEDDRATRERLWLRGGFPDPFLAADDAESIALRRDLVRTYLHRDVAMFGPRVPASAMERLWTMLAHGQGGLLNASEIARALEVSTQSVTRYVDLLCDLLLARRLPPLHANTTKRLVKAPKVYVRDSGLVHALLGLDTAFRLLGHPVAGSSWEGFVIENLLAVAPSATRAAFYRTAVGAEIDLVLDFAHGERWAIEIKRAAAARPGRGFHQALIDVAPTRAFMVHAGDDAFPISSQIEAVGLGDLMGRLRAAG